MSWLWSLCSNQVYKLVVICYALLPFLVDRWSVAQASRNAWVTVVVESVQAVFELDEWLYWTFGIQLETVAGIWLWHVLLSISWVAMLVGVGGALASEAAYWIIVDSDEGLAIALGYGALIRSVLAIASWQPTRRRIPKSKRWCNVIRRWSATTQL